MSIFDSVSEAVSNAKTKSLLGRKFRQGSFRGASFFIDTSEYEGGRRTADHEYPGRDTPFSEDLGRKAREFQFDCYVLGKSYSTLRDSLLKACEASGSGKLVHPFYGTVTVVCKSFRIRENLRESGIAVFSLNFREAGQELFPSASRDSSSLMPGSVASAVTSITAAFAEGFNVINTAGYVVDAAQDQVDAAADLVGSAASGIKSATKDITNLAFKIRNLKASVRDLVRTPSLLAKAFSDSVSLLSDAVTGPNRDGVRDAYLGLIPYGTDFPTISLLTASRKQQAQNQSAMIGLMRQLAAVNAAQEAVNSTYSNEDSAKSVRDQIAGFLDDQMSSTTSDSVFSSLQDVKTNLLNSVPSINSDLPRLVKQELDQTESSLTLCYQHFESLDLEDTVIGLNSVRHPGFVQGGRTIVIPSSDANG